MWNTTETTAASVAATGIPPTDSGSSSPSAVDRGRARPSTYTIAQPPAHWFEIPEDDITTQNNDCQPNPPVLVTGDLLSTVNSTAEDNDAVTLVNVPGSLRSTNPFDRRASLHAALVAEHQAAAAALAARAEHDRLERAAIRERQQQAAAAAGGIWNSIDSWNRWSAKFYMPWINRWPQHHTGGQAGVARRG